MSPVFSKNLGVCIFILMLTLTGCTLPDGPSGTATPTGHEFVTVIEEDLTRDWYVATDGDDTNSCATPEAPCLTLGSAAARAFSLDRIHIAAGVYLGSDGLGEQLPRIYNKNLTITGEGSGVTILDANNTYGGIYFYGPSPVHLQLQGLTIQNTDRGYAGCIETSLAAALTAEDVVLDNCWRSGLTHGSSGLVHLIDVIISNSRDENTDPDFTVNGSGIVNFGELLIEGGEIRNSERIGIENAGPLTVTGTTIRDNTWGGVESSFTGASSFTNVTIANNGLRFLRDGMFIDAGEVTISGSTITANGSQAIFLRGPVTLLMNTSTISDHPSLALNIFAGVVVDLDDVTITNNGLGGEWGPVIRNEGNIKISKSHIINNFQQALYNIDEGVAIINDSEISGNRSEFTTIVNRDVASEMFISRSLIANNTVTDPFLAALSNDGVMELENTTISNNSQAGIRMDSQTTLSYVTIAENDGVGINQGGSGPFTIENTLVAKNSGGDCQNFFAFPDGSLLFTGALSGTNIDTDGTCGFPETYSPAEIRLGGLADNGGLTFTHELLHAPDSPAIDTAIGACPATDQREFGRAGLCDVGAYETSAVALSLDDTDLVIGTPTPDGPGTVTITTTTPCYNGPGPQYGQVSNLASGITAQLIGAGFTGNGNQDWVVTHHPTAANTNCWLDTDDVTPSVPFSEMRLISIPGLPTPTTKPTSDRPAPDDTPIPCYYDQQQQQLICP